MSGGRGWREFCRQAYITEIVSQLTGFGLELVAPRPASELGRGDVVEVSRTISQDSI
jgi:hypothetical protein